MSRSSSPVLFYDGRESDIHFEIVASRPTPNHPRRTLTPTATRQEIEEYL